MTPDRYPRRGKLSVHDSNSTKSPLTCATCKSDDKDNFAVDRERADQILAKIPDMSGACQANRRFLGRAVQNAVEQGIRQFIDIGTGLPNQGNVHQVAQSIEPDARVVYVDNDPIVLAHARALLATNDSTTVIQEDMREPAKILAHPEVDRLIDFSQPLAVLFVAVLHFVTDEEDPAGLVHAFTDRMAPGSQLILSHVTHDGHPPEQVKVAEDVYRGATAPFVFRGREEIMRLFNGFTLMDPGLVRLSQWRPGPDEQNLHGGHWAFAGVGYKPPARP